MHRIHGMIGSLSDEAEKVLRTTRRLSSTLRRLLDRRVISSRLRLANVLREIRAAAVRLAEHRPRDDVGIEIQSELELVNVWDRPFWTTPVEFAAAELNDHQPDEGDCLAAFRHLAALQRLDWESMRDNCPTPMSIRYWLGFRLARHVDYTAPPLQPCRLAASGSPHYTFLP